MKFKKEIYSSFFFVGLLIEIVAVLCYANYIPGTILSGWDTLHPEFNLSLYISRITSVWQSHQGLGAPPSQAHLAEIPRMLFYIPLTLLFPVNFVRYSFIFLMIIIGAIGQYKFISYLLTNKKHNNSYILYASAFIGALYYCLNLGSVQQFIVILEMFAVQFAILGFFYYSALRFIESPTKKRLLVFVITCIFSGSMGHTATLWYVFYGCFILFLASYTIHFKIPLKKLILVGALPLIINLYWILPNLYYSLHYGSVMSNSKINRLFSTEAYLQNKQYGTLLDLAQLKNFLFNWDVVIIQNDKTTTIPLLSAWITHFNNPSVILIAILLFFFGLFGLFLVHKNKDKKLMSFTPIFLICSFFLLTNTPILSSIFETLRAQSTIFKEAFRFPFTKLSFLYVFSASIFIAYATQTFLNLISRLFKNKWSVKFTSLLIAVSIVWYMFPAFQGNYISPIIKTKIPQEYFDLFEWSKKQEKNKRFLTLPFQSLFGWVIYEWDNKPQKEIYQGAGFTWFGMQQPTLNREFDRWYPYNEQAYGEFLYATSTDNDALFKLALDKYNVSYILLDKNVVYDTTEKKQETKNLEQLLQSNKEIQLVQQFKNLYVFSYIPSVNHQTIIKYPVIVSPNIENSYIDHAYYEYSDYITEKNGEVVYFPGRDIINQVGRLNKDKLHINKDDYTIDIPTSISALKYPDIADVENEVFAQVRLEDKHLALSYFLPYMEGERQPEQWISMLNSDDKNILFINDVQIQKNGQNIVLSTNKNEIITTYSPTPDTNKKELKDVVIVPYICSQQTTETTFGGENKNGFISLYSDNEPVCTDISIPTKQGYLAQLNASFVSEKTQGISICNLDPGLDTCTSPTYLNNERGNINIFIPPTNQNAKVRIKLIPRPNQKHELGSATFSSVNTTYYNQTSSLPFTVSLPKKTNGSGALIGTFPEDQLISSTLFTSKPYVCLGQTPQFSKKTNNDTSITYETTGGALCENIELDKKNQKVSQILEISSENMDGIPFRICLKDEETKKCVLEDELTSFKSTNTDYFIIPPYNHQGGYTLILKNLSLGNFPSKNNIKNIYLKTFPYNLLIGMHSESFINKLPPSVPYIKNDMVFYTNDLGYINIKGVPKNTYISLPESYEENWQAYIVSDNSFINIFFAPLLGKRLNNHTVLNNWSNAWILSDDCIDSQCTIAYIFTPVYLYYFGLILSLISFIVIFVFPSRHKTSIV